MRALLLGIGGDRLRHQLSPQIVLLLIPIAFVAAEAMLIAGLPMPSLPLWASSSRSELQADAYAGFNRLYAAGASRGR